MTHKIPRLIALLMMLALSIALTFLLMSMFFAATSSAAPPATDVVAIPVDLNSDLDPFLKILLIAASILASVATPIAVAIARKVARRIETSTGLMLTDDAAKIATTAVGLAEQYGERKLAASGLKIPGVEKMKIARSFFEEIANNKKWPEWVKAQSEAWIESKIAEKPKAFTLVDATGSDR